MTADKNVRDEIFKIKSFIYNKETETQKDINLEKKGVD